MNVPTEDEMQRRYARRKIHEDPAIECEFEAVASALKCNALMILAYGRVGWDGTIAVGDVEWDVSLTRRDPSSQRE